MDTGIRNTLIAIPLLLGASYGGLKLYLHNRYASALDEAIQDASLFAEIRYKGLSTTLGGELRVEGITITPHAEYTDEFQIEAVRIVTSGLSDLLDSGRSVERGELPRTLRLVVEGLEVPMDGFTMGYLDEAAEVGKRAVPKDAEWKVFAVSGMTCGGCERRVIAHLGRLEGVVAVEADAELGQVRVASAKGAKLDDTVKSSIAKLGYKIAAQ